MWQQQKKQTKKKLLNNLSSVLVIIGSKFSAWCGWEKKSFAQILFPEKVHTLTINPIFTLNFRWLFKKKRVPS